MSQELDQAIQHHRAGQLQAAVRIYQSILQKDSGNAEALHLFGLAHLQSGRPRQAVQLMRMALSRNRKDPKYFSNLGEAYRVLRQFDDAIGCLLSAIHLNPDFVEARVNLGMTYFNQFRLDEAAEQFAEAIRIQPSQPRHQCSLGDVLRAQGHYSIAEARYRYALMLNSNMMRAQCQLGNVLLKLGDAVSAEKHCRKAVESRPRNVEALAHLGRCLVQLGRSVEAKEILEKASAFNPKSPILCDALGQAWHEAGDHDKAKQWLQRALDNAPDYVPASCHLAILQADTGETDQAKKRLQKILADYPLWDEARSALAAIDGDAALVEIDAPHTTFYPKTLSGEIWPGAVHSEAAQVWSAYLTLDRTQWLSPQEIEQNQMRQAQRLLNHCYHHVPYYRDLWKRHGIHPRTIDTIDAFRRLPLLQRYEYQQAADKFRAEILPEGMRQTGELSTSGTTGVPVQIRQTNMVALWYRAFFLRDLEWSGIDPRGSFAGIRMMGKTEQERQRFMRGIHFPFWSRQLNRTIQTGPSYAMDIHQSVDKQLEWLHTVRPNYLLSYPSNLEMLAAKLREKNTRIDNLRGIQAIAEQMSPEMQTGIEKAFGVPVKNLYSCNEAGYLATPCPEGHGLHVHAENVLFEVLDEDGFPCKPGETGRVVFTTLHNFITPMIRYEIADEAQLGPNPCPCGRGLPLLSRVQGKVRPFFKFADGSKVSPVALLIDVREIGGYHQHQFIQHAPDRVTIRLVPSNQWSWEKEEAIKERALEFFGEGVTVGVEVVDRIPLPAGGKLRDVMVEC